MKKIAALSAAAMMCLSMSAFAASTTEPIKDRSTTFTYEHKNEPTYTVTVPAAVALTDEGTKMDFVASNVKYLDGKKISVKVESTDAYKEQMVLKCRENNGTMRYQLVLEDDSIVETNAGQGIVAVGKELVSFTKNGTKTITARPADNSGSSSYKVGSYSGIMNYSISLEDAE